MIVQREKLADGWYWCHVRGFDGVRYQWREEWLVVEMRGWWRWDMQALQRYGVSDMTALMRYVGPIERPEVTE